MFFYQAPSGGRVLFDELGPPWPKHPCTDNPRVSVALAPKPAPTASRRLSADRRLAGWQVDGWAPIQIESSTRVSGAHAMRCVTWEGGYREFQVFLDEEVRVRGAAAAAMRPWDEGGHTIISFVELDTGAAPRSIQISRSAPGQTRHIIERLLKVVAIAEDEAEVVDIEKAIRRFDELERVVATWAQHLSEDEANPHWARFHAACSRAKNRVVSAQRAELAEKERLVSELETLAHSSEWESVSTRFAEVLERWRAGGGLGRSGTADLGNRFVAAEQACLAKQADAKRTRAKIARVAVKQKLIAELNGLAQTTDWSVADRRHQNIKKRWNSTGHFKEGDEAWLSEAFREAESTYAAARARALAEAAARRDARAREARIATKTQLITALEALLRTADWSVADGRYREIKQRWITAGHFASEGESELSEAFEGVEAAYLEARDEARATADRERAIRDAEERRAEQESVVAEAENLARAPYWDAEGFEKLSLRWKASGSPFESALRARFLDAYMVARGPGFKDAIRARLHIIAEAARLSDVAGWDERALRFVEVAAQWDAAAWAGPDMELPLRRRYQTTIDAFLVACDADDLEGFLAQAKDARLRPHGSGGCARVKVADADLDSLVRLSTAVREVRVLTGDSPAER
ncbi:DUF349 domain-containing protein [Terrabacter ginsenosidimutans]|uniref:DUF349 domain-containing protein n=1 Tax=Terrabacter ginsenosidimutans TaxID=490575 RepID=UPI0031EAC119